jgi:outer membrane receptor for ferric coprogen and ferric-rhodotorulic acid
LARHLTDRDIESIVEIIDGYTGKLTWDNICEAAINVIGKRPTRQSLNSYTRIKTAFLNKKKRLKLGLADVKRPASLKIAGQRIARLREKNARLKQENDLLLEQFVVWQYNAYIYGMTKEQLNNPLPPIDRDSSET